MSTLLVPAPSLALAGFLSVDWGVSGHTPSKAILGHFRAFHELWIHPSVLLPICCWIWDCLSCSSAFMIGGNGFFSVAS